MAYKTTSSHCTLRVWAAAAFAYCNTFLGGSQTEFNSVAFPGGSECLVAGSFFSLFDSFLGLR